ncbi:hypothetical protein CC80DRAFT_488296 [Byssothecium circinans]|uniref:INO80 complex subunit F domain-containing protein n=1 Tax=Byssothecium circinans TaxID=147558 RepID=A0A6A5UDV7_9PLEO|nr:hypothetical protein CC80DRAFT_488296 [Byssothecium circinans]
MPQPAAPAPAPPARAYAQKDLPPSVEMAYYRKCIDLRRRIKDVEESNDGTRLRISRLHRGVQKMRLERAFLLDQLSKHMEYNVDDSDRSSSPPPTPTDKPLRSKRSHRKATPPPGGQLGGGPSSMPHASPGSTHHHQQILQSMNPMSSAQSTPDPSRAAPFFSAMGGSAASPHAVNGNAPQTLPPLQALQPLQPQREPSRGAYFDPTQPSEQPPADAENDTEQSGRPRAHSGAVPPPPEAREAQNGDTEMTDVSGFTTVNPR